MFKKYVLSCRVNSNPAHFQLAPQRNQSETPRPKPATRLQVTARGEPLRREQKMARNSNGRRVTETRDYTPEAIYKPAGDGRIFAKGVIYLE